MTLKIVTPPAAEPVTVAEVMTWSRIDAVNSPGAPMLEMMITAARRIAESRTGRKMITQVWELLLDGFPTSEIEVGVLPIQSIHSITYYDEDSVLQTLDPSSYVLDPNVLPGWILPALEATWPGTHGAANAVIARLNLGYGTAGSDVPADIRMWISAQVSAAFENPTGLLNGEASKLRFIDGLLDDYMIGRVV